MSMLSHSFIQTYLPVIVPTLKILNVRKHISLQMKVYVYHHRCSFLRRVKLQLRLFRSRF